MPQEVSTFDELNKQAPPPGPEPISSFDELVRGESVAKPIPTPTLNLDVAPQKATEVSSFEDVTKMGPKEERGGLLEALSGIPAGFTSSVEMFGRVGRTLGVPGSDFLVDVGKSLGTSFEGTTEDIIPSSIRGGIESTIQSVTAGILGALAGSIGGPIGAVAGFATSAGIMFSLAEYDQFMEELVNNARAGGLDEASIDELKGEMQDKAIISALAEGGFEAISDLAQAKIFGFLGGKSLAAPVKKGIMEVLGKYFVNTAKVTSVELPTELATTAVQVYEREQADIPVPDMTKALKQTVGPVVVQSLLRGGAGAVLANVKHDRELKQEQAALLNMIGEGANEEEIKKFISGSRILSVIAGRDGMQAIFDEDVEKDIKIISEWFASPEFALREFPEAQRMSGKIIEATFMGDALSEEDRVLLNDIKKDARKIDRKNGEVIVSDRVRAMVGLSEAKRNMESDDEDVRDKAKVEAAKHEKRIREIDSEHPDARPVAERITKFFEDFRDDIITYKRIMFLKTMRKNEALAFKAIIEGESVETAAKNNHVKVETMADVLQEFADIESWGIDDYVTKMEKGTYRFVDNEGQTVLVAQTKKQAIDKAVEYLKNNPDVTSLTLDTTFPGIDSDFKTAFTREQFFAITGNIYDAVKENAKELSKAIRKKDVVESIGRVVEIKPSSKFAGPMVKRKNLLTGERNLFDILYSYSFAMRRKMTIDPVAADLREALGTMPKNVRNLVYNQFEDAKGRYYPADKIVDNLLKAFGVKPLAFTRSVSSIRKVEANLKLGYRMVAALVNLMGGMGHTWTKVGIKYMGKAASFMKTEEGKKFLAEEEPYLGLAFSVDEAFRVKTKGHPLSPLKLFTMAEPANRKMSIAANYLYAKENMGMNEGEAREFARRSVRFQQFTYNTASVSRILRGPTGKLLGQFKTYLVKEIEFIRQLKGKEWLRYIGMQLTMAGPRGFVYVMRSIPILGALGLWDYFEEWLNEPHPDIPVAGDFVPTLSRGLVGTVGGDITAPAVVQLPNRPEDWAGPFLSDVLRMYDNIIGPSLRGEGYDIADLKDWVRGLAPATYYWDQLLQSIVDEEGWVRDSAGNKLYLVDSNWQRVLLAMSIPPIEKTQMDVALRILRHEERVRNERAIKTVRKIARYISQGKDIPPELIDAAVMLGISYQTIKEAIVRREMPPVERVLRQTRRAARPRALELLENQ